MKRLTAIILGAAITVGASAQTMYDGLTFSQNNYYGTARSIALGNAMTALGGDLGSITINPAGSAVNSYSQFTITPDISVATSKASFSALPGTDAYSNEMTDSYTRFTMPNLGLTFNYNTGKNYGLKRITFGIVSNGTANYVNTMVGGGVNDMTSYMGALATEAGGWSSSVLEDYNSYYNSNAPWNSIMAFRAGLISTYDGYDADYIGASETIFLDNSIGLAGPQNLLYGRRSYGSKNDVAFNVGFNISDVFFIGANLGLVALTYQYDEYIKESAVNPGDFAIDFGDGQTVYYDNMRSSYSYFADGSGVYGKFGFLYTPANGFRLGAAIQTPTSLDIREKWQSSAESHFSQRAYDASDTTPEGEYSYRFVSPFRFNVGVAYTFYDVALISADYERCDYSSMKFKEVNTNDNSAFSDVNYDIRDFMGASNMLRVGVEARPVPSFAIRAGYNLTTSPEFYLNEFNSKVRSTAKTNAFSFGLGYSTKGSFFADLACRYTRYPDEYTTPYGDYIDDTPSPEFWNLRNCWDIVATIGFRF